jgi:PAS domain-containing protein
MMTTIDRNPSGRAALRSRAVANLKGPGVKTDPSAALGVLYELASSPSTALDALALLHELQVHQVEIDLQDEELRRSRAELETSLNRQIQLYDSAPVGYLTLDFNTVLRELNQTGAVLLGFERDFLRGQALDSFLTAESVQTLRAMLGRIAEGATAEGATAESADLVLRSTPDRETRCMHASACLDPAGGGYLVGLIGVNGAKAAPGA